MCTIEYCNLLYFKEDGNESYVALSGDFSIIPEMEYLVIQLSSLTPTQMYGLVLQHAIVFLIYFIVI